MTREEAKKLLPLLTAFAEGKTIQNNENGIWLDLADCIAIRELILFECRIKPEKREYWVVKTRKKHDLLINEELRKTENEAHELATYYKTNLGYSTEVFRVIEP